MASHSYKAGPFLEQIITPNDLREKFTEEQLPQVADELRQYIVDVISDGKNPGASAFTRIFFRPVHCAARSRVNPISPALLEA